MIRSMTGYGKAVHQLADKKVTVEIRSLNSKQLDLSVRLPGMYKGKEPELRSIIAKQLERGKVDCVMSFEITGEDNRERINTPVVKGYFDELTALSEDLAKKTDASASWRTASVYDYLNIIMRIPGVLIAKHDEPIKEEWKKIKISVNKAILELMDFRINEGKALEQDLIKRNLVIQDLLKEIEPYESRRIDTIKARLHKDLSSLLGNIKIDENRFEQELIYYIEKMDFTEEKVRLKTHCDYFLKTLKEPEANGKKLGFIVQEIGREINTIGSKANDADIQKIVVEMKDELEKVKEQLFNVL
ncbi:MAG: YicC/YloC family endoribonuclease [Bacteroidota bacterium]